MQLDELVEVYTLQQEANGRSSHTTAQARRHARLLGSWLVATGRGSAIEAIGHEDIAAFFASECVRYTRAGRPRKPTSANALRSSIRTIFAFAHAANYVSASPARMIQRARCGGPPPRALSEIDQAKLLGALAQAKTTTERRDRALFEMLLRSGPRIGSALAARVEDLDLDAGELLLRREKGRRERALFLSEAVVELLRSHTAGRTSGPLFPGAHGLALTARHAARRLADWCRRAGIRVVSPHCLRHSFACVIYRRTGDLLLTRDALGHASVTSTTIYARVETERLRAAVRS